MISGCVYPSLSFMTDCVLTQLLFIWDVGYVGRDHIHCTGAEAEPNVEGIEPEREQAGRAGFGQHRRGSGECVP